MTQSMKQSIEILQMPLGELNEYINKELEENPVLETTLDKDEDKFKENYCELVKYFKLDSYIEKNEFEYKEDKYISPLNYIEDKISLKDYLFGQLREINIDRKIKRVVSYMIESLDKRGYLDISVEEISSDLNEKKEKVYKALEILQSLEPVGIGARSLSECLLIQIRRKNIYDNVLDEIISKYLDLIANNKYGHISKRLNITMKMAQSYGDIIKSLEPKPSRGYYTGEEEKFIIPDVYVFKINKEYNIIINNTFIPNLKINSLYKNIILDSVNNESVYYVKEKINNAMNLIKSIEQRNNTILKIIQSIIKYQKEYFNYGKEFLKPMYLKDIALDIGMHESTVSRAIRDKYILTNYGTIKIKDLFSISICNKSSGNEEFLAIDIKKKIKEIINKENKNKPLSDKAICEIINNMNYPISRRTITKYREEIGIRASCKRKRI